jgi:hypothetical protein
MIAAGSTNCDTERHETTDLITVEELESACEKCKYGEVKNPEGTNIELRHNNKILPITYP